MSAVGHLIGVSRERMGLTQTKAAKLLGVSTVFYHRIEKGVAALPVKRIDRLAEILQISPEEIRAAMRKDFDDHIKYFPG